MLSESWFRFGLPLGSAIIIVGILDTATNLFSAWMDLGGVFIYHINQSVKLDPLTITWTLLVIVWNASNLGLLWGGVIINGKSSLLMAWLATTIVCTAVALLIWIYVLWVIWGYWNYLFGEIYAIFTFLLTTGYILNVAFMCLKPLKAGEPIEPIGKGVKHLIKFYRDDPTLAGKFLLISELIIIGEYVFTRQMMQFAFARDMSGHEGDTSAGIVAEEYIIRALRFILSSVGIYFVTKGKVHELKYWGMAYFGLIIASAIIFIYLIFCWSAEHILFTVGYYITFFLSLIYRSGILYICMQVMRPYMNSSTFLTLQENH